VRGIPNWQRLLIISLSLFFFKTRLHAEPPPAIEQPSNEAAVRTPPRIDPNHPLTFHYQFYPPKSIGAGVEGVCVVALYVDTDGQIGRVQLLNSCLSMSGFQE
jgi:hypothetical protein